MGCVPVSSNVRDHVRPSTNKLSDESVRATELLAGKVVARVVRHRESEVLVEFTDNARLFVNHTTHGVELSVTGIQEGTQTGEAFACCFCEESINQEMSVELSVQIPDGGTQVLWSHTRCLYPRLHESVPVLP